MTSVRAMTVVAAGVVMALCPRLRAEDANAVFESLYGQEVKRALATADRKDDIELAGKLVAAAAKSDSQPELMVVLCQKAHELASRTPAGCPVAIEAIELLYEKLPAQRPACRLKLLGLYQTLYLNGRGAERQNAGEELVDLHLEVAEEKADANDWSGAVEHARKALGLADAIGSPLRDAVQARFAELVQRERTEKQAAELAARLAADPANRALRENLIRLLVVELDDPRRAAALVDSSLLEEGLKTYVPLAAKDPAELPEPVCLELAEWYRGLGDKAPQGSKLAMYERARTCLQTFLARHLAEDLAKTKARLALEDVEATIAKLAAASDPRNWVDVLRLVELPGHVTGGAWQRQEHKLLVSSRETARATVPVLPEGSYEYQVKFTRTSGSGSLFFMLPVGKAWCSLVLGRGGGAFSGVQMIDGRPAGDNATTVRAGRLENNKEHVLDVSVALRGSRVFLAARLNGEKLLQWEGTESSLTPGMDTEFLGRRALALVVGNCSAVYSAARLRVVTGSAQLLQDGREGPRGFPRIVVPGRTRIDRRGLRG